MPIYEMYNLSGEDIREVEKLVLTQVSRTGTVDEEKMKGINY